MKEKDANNRTTTQTRGTYSSISHFYRAIDDFQTNLQHEESKSNAKAKVSATASTAKSKSDKGWISRLKSKSPANARRVVRSNEDVVGDDESEEKETSTSNEMPSQDLLNGRIGSIHSFLQRFNNTNGKNNFKGFSLSQVINYIIRAIPRKYKMFIGFIAVMCTIMTLIWTGLACFGIYYIVKQHTLSHRQVEYTARLAESFAVQHKSPHEIVLRIIPADEKVMNGVDIDVDREKLISVATNAIRDELIRTDTESHQGEL